MYRLHDFIKRPINIDFDKENKKRWSLKLTIDEKAKETLIVILRNPSKAGLNCPEESDVTVNRVTMYIYKNREKYDFLKYVGTVIILNLIPLYETDSSLLKNILGYNILDKKNFGIIDNLTQKHNKVIIAWGKHPKGLLKEYRELINNVFDILKKNNNSTYCIGNGYYPLHGQVWGYDYPLTEYNLE